MKKGGIKMFDESAEIKAGKSTLGFVLLGPLFGLIYVLLLPLIALLTLLLALPEFATAKKPDIIENAGMCMACHSSEGMTKVFRNKDKLSVFVNEADFKGTVHSFLSCTDCHQTVSLDSHPGTVYDSRSAFVLEAVGSCRNCHPDAQLQAKPNHAFLVNKTNGPPCSDCHGAHSIKRISEWKPTLAGNQYCLTCHSHKITKSYSDGEKLSLFIDPSILSSSVHNRHACSDCHSEFTRTSHPAKTFENSRTHSIAVSVACSQCHPDKVTAVKSSIHYNLSLQVGEATIIKGNPKAPVCTDCHGFHSVGPKDTYDTLAGVPCRKCHEDIFGIYSKSVHGMARQNGRHEAPLCSSCHFAHEIATTAMAEKIRSACLTCHEGIESKHDAWLPNAGLHLSAVACAACHSPRSEKGIYLKLYNETTGKPFTEDEISALLGTTSGELADRLNSHGEGIDSAELWNIVKQLNEKGTEAKVTFLGSMNVNDGSDAHRLSVKKEAVKECENCHYQDSDYFRNVTVAMVKADGKMAQYKAKPEVLASMFSLLSLKQFYVLGSTRLKILDWLGIAMVLGGMMVPVAHITLRVLTLPAREARKLRNNKKRKEV